MVYQDIPPVEELGMSAKIPTSSGTSLASSVQVSLTEFSLLINCSQVESSLSPLELGGNRVLRSV